MALTDQQLASALIGSAGAGQIANVMRGVAVADSSDGRVDVLITGSVVGAADATGDSLTADSPSVVSLATIGHVAEGEPVVILTSGSAGGAHSMVAIGAIGGGDMLAGVATGASASAAAALGQLSGLTLTPIWSDGSGWSSLASGVVSQVRFEGLVASLGMSSGSRGLLVGHLRALYSNSSSEGAWTSHGLARLTDWSFPVGLTAGITSSVRNFGLAVSISYVYADSGSRDISMIHADQLPATTNAWMHTDIISYVQHV